MNITMGHRALAIRQGAVTMFVGALTMVSLYLAEQVNPTIDRYSLDAWALATLANVVIRVALSIRLFWGHVPADMVKSAALRLVPVIIAALATAQWVWTIWLFVDQTPGPSEFILFAGLLGTSVAVMSMWPTAPAAALIFSLSGWGMFFFSLSRVNPLSWPALLALALAVGVVMWACAFLHIHQLQTVLDKSDEVDLLVATLHQANADLTTANATLDSMRGAAAGELEARSIFFSSASHDFRQRLHAMSLMANSAANAINREHKASPTIRRLADAVEDVERYIADVLDFARFEGSAMQPDRHSLDLQSLFQKLELDFEDVASEHHATLLLRPTEFVLHTDGLMLQRILENLISNAIKFTSGKVIVAARPRGSSVAIQVWDQGDGIPPEDQASIFKPFYRSASGRNGLIGVGLGLAVVSRFSDCLGYGLSVRSSNGRGTVMTVLVPETDVLPHVRYAKPSTRFQRHIHFERDLKEK